MKVSINRIKNLLKNLYFYPLYIYSLGRISDIFTTSLAINKYGIYVEMNKRILELLKTYGNAYGLLIAEIESLSLILPIVLYKLFRKKGDNSKYFDIFVDGTLSTVGALSLYAGINNFLQFLYALSAK